MKEFRIIIALLACLCSQFAGARQLKVELLLSAGELQLDSVPLNVIPGEGLFAALGNKLVNLDREGNHDLREVALPDSVIIDDFIAAGPSLVFKCDRSLLWQTPEGGFWGITLEDADFRLIYGTPERVAIYRPGARQLLEVSLAERRPVLSMKMDEPLIAASRIGTGIVTVTQTRVLTWFEGEAGVLHRHPAVINCAAITPQGVFLGTDRGLWSVRRQDELELLGAGTVKALLCDGERLYLIDGGGNLYRAVW